MTPLEQIRAKIDNRPVAVVCPGPSIAQLPDYLLHPAPSPYSIFWAGIPKWWTIERDILCPAKQQVDFVWTNCTMTIKHEAPHLSALVDRRGLFGTGSEGRATAIKYGVPSDKIMDIIPPRINALTGMLIILRLARVDRVFIFGCDGDASPGGTLHFAQHEFEGQEWYKDASAPRLREEAGRVNSKFESMCAQVGARHPTHFINANPGSKVTIFETMPMEDAVHYLCKGA